MPNRISILLISFLIISLYSCGDNSTGPDTQAGIISGKISATDDGEGIEDALLILFAKDSVNQKTFSNSEGEFNFHKVNPGQYKVEATLPEGFKKSGSLQKAINVDGSVKIDFNAEPIREKTETITKGTKDTLFTSSGAFIAVDASEASDNIEVTIKEMNDGELFNDSDIITKPVQVWIHPSGTTKSSASSAKQIGWSASNTSSSSRTITLGQKISDPSKFTGNAILSISGDNEREPLRLYANANAKTYVDSITDQKSKYFERSFQPPSNINVEFSMGFSLPWKDNCSGSDDFRELKPIQSDTTGKKALILIHGLQPFKGNCKDFKEFDPEKESFKSLIKKLQDSDVNKLYKLYTYRYPTNASIIPSADELWDSIQAKKINKPVLLAHSMGGLVGRVLMEKEGNDKVAGLITLGTPHEGSPVADLALNLKAGICTFIPSTCLATYLSGTSILPITEGLRELKPESPLINSLENAKGDPRKIFTLGGNLIDSKNVGGKNTIIYQTLYKLMKDNGQKNDGMVPLKSAIPQWSGLQTVIQGHDHSEMVAGNDFGNSKSNSVINQIIPILQELYSCEPPPKRVTSNDFIYQVQ